MSRSKHSEAQIIAALKQVEEASPNSGEKNLSLAYTGKVLKQISLLRDRVADWQGYPFSVPSKAQRSQGKDTSRSSSCYLGR